MVMADSFKISGLCIHEELWKYFGNFQPVAHTELHIPIILGHHQACKILQSCIISLLWLLYFTLLCLFLSHFSFLSVKILYEADNKTTFKPTTTINSHNWEVEASELVDLGASDVSKYLVPFLYSSIQCLLHRSSLSHKMNANCSQGHKLARLRSVGIRALSHRSSEGRGAICKIVDCVEDACVRSR